MSKRPQDDQGRMEPGPVVRVPEGVLRDDEMQSGGCDTFRTVPPRGHPSDEPYNVLQTAWLPDPRIPGVTETRRVAVPLQHVFEGNLLKSSIALSRPWNHTAGSSCPAYGVLGLQVVDSLKNPYPRGGFSPMVWARGRARDAAPR